MGGRNKRKKIENVEAHFLKKYDFWRDHSWILPQIANSSQKWSLESLQNKKRELNNVKELLHGYDLEEWSRHTRSRDPSTAVLRKLRSEFDMELLTQAWCKCYEILHQFDVLPVGTEEKQRFKSLHLCEAPGAFVCALNHYLSCNNPNIKWSWVATTLNPHYEGNSQAQMISDDRFIKHTYAHWDFGADFTGDITKYENHLALIETCEKDVMLVTADGSVDCMLDPGNQEIRVEHLHYCEAMTALRILGRGGNFVMKIFTMFEASTISLLYLLNCAFEKVSVFKPLTSKGGNSEVYVICVNYRSVIHSWDHFLQPYKLGVNDNSLFKLSEIPHDFLEQLHECAGFFMQKQVQVITDNIKYFGRSGVNVGLKAHNRATAEHFVRKYNLSNIPGEHRIVPHVNVASCFTQRKAFRDRHPYKIVQIKENVDIDLKIGRQFKKVRHTCFCAPENVSKLADFNRNANSPLYNAALALITPKYTVVNLSHFNSTEVPDIHASFLATIRNIVENVNKNVVIVGPLLTSFLVGVLFLLVNSYESAIFFRTGCVVLRGLSEATRNNLKKLLKTIQEKQLAASGANLEAGVLQIVPFALLETTTFLDAVLCYNNNLANFWTTDSLYTRTDL